MSQYNVTYGGRSRNIGYIKRGVFFKAIYPRNVFKNMGDGAIGFDAELFLYHILNSCHTIKIQLRGHVYRISTLEAEERARFLEFDNHRLQVFVELCYFTKTNKTRKHGNI